MEGQQKLTEHWKEKYNKLELKYKALETEYNQYQRESIKWGTSDFIERAGDIGYTITEEQAQAALERMIHKHDCECGITWDTVDHYIEQYGTCDWDEEDDDDKY